MMAGTRSSEGSASGDGHGAIDWVHRASSLVLGVGLCVFGVLGFVNRLSFFATTGPTVLGLSTNGLLSTVSLVVGALLVVAAARGGRLASTTAVVVGALFMLSGVANVLVLATPYNVLSFRMPNVVFSLVAGALLLTTGAYGRFTGRLPDGNPYRRSGDADPVDATHSPHSGQQLPTGPEDVAAARELADAERAVAAGAGTPTQRRVLAEVRARRDPAGRRSIWRRLTR